MINSRWQIANRKLYAIRYTLYAKRGFTLIELLIVIGIIWALAGVSAPFLSTFLGSRQLTTTVDKVVRTLRKAQNYALSGKEDDVWGVHYESKLLVLFKGSSYDADDPFGEKFNLPRATTIAGLDDLYFEKLRGEPSGIPPITITISTPQDQRTITVNSEGAADVQ